MQGLLAIAIVTTAVMQPVDGFPPVVLSDEHRQQVLVEVGQPFPEIELPQAGNDEVEPLSDSFGEAGTVVVWIADLDRQAKTLIRDLQPDVIELYAKRNVGLVVIAIGDQVDLDGIRELGYTGPVHHDPRGEAFAAVGSDSLPRVYVLDQQHQIAWFDIEYSQTTRRELGQSLKLLAPAE